MRLLIVSGIACLAGGLAVFTAIEGSPFPLSNVATAIGIDESAQTSAVTLAQVETVEEENAGEAAPASGKPAEATETDPASATEAASTSEKDVADEGLPSSSNAFAPTDKPAIAMPPLGLPDPDEAQAALPDEQKITLQAAPADAPKVGTIRWAPDSLYCGFVENDLPESLELASADAVVKGDDDGEAGTATGRSENVENQAVAVEKLPPEDLLFVTERHYDGRAAVERGYMRLGGLMRELSLKSTEEKESGELRHYATLGGAPIDVRLDMQRIVTDADRKLKAWHKPDRLLYRGAMTVGRGEATRQVGFIGSCR